MTIYSKFGETVTALWRGVPPPSPDQVTLILGLMTIGVIMLLRRENYGPVSWERTSISPNFRTINPATATSSVEIPAPAPFVDLTTLGAGVDISRIPLGNRPSPGMISPLTNDPNLRGEALVGYLTDLTVRIERLEAMKNE